MIWFVILVEMVSLCFGISELVSCMLFDSLFCVILCIFEGRSCIIILGGVVVFGVVCLWFCSSMVVMVSVVSSVSVISRCWCFFGVGVVLLLVMLRVFVVLFWLSMLLKFVLVMCL